MPPEGLDVARAPAGLAAELTTDARLVARMRLVLALAVLLAIQVEPRGLPGMDPSRWPVFVAYALYGLVVDVGAQRQARWAQGTTLHWLDVGWYALMVMLTGGVSSVVFLFFFFAILTASLRWGQAEGRRVTVVSALAFALSTLLAQWPPDITRLLLRASFLLGLGYLCVHWGEAQVQLRRRLALLREVSQLSNPRFGVDHTLQHVLATTGAYFGASSCVLVLRERHTSQAWMRQVRAQGGPADALAEAITPEVARLLLPFAPEPLLVHRGHGRWRRLQAATHCLLPTLTRWQAAGPGVDTQARELAELLEAGSFISVPVALRQGQGRLHVCCKAPTLGRDDAVFLCQLVAQAFPMIDHIELLDRMTSEAAARERQKFALDLHDTAIQPYIGLTLGLSALRQKATPDNPLSGDLEKLEAMARRVSEDLRRYARQVRQQRHSEPAFLAELKRQAAQVRDFYGVDIDVQVEGELQVNDRLSAEVLQVVREGLANICKHTLAQRGEVRLQCRGGWLGICISNEGSALEGDTDFTPRSISERAAALGGRAHVQHERDGRTAVHVHIPV